jgi:hypothetical protein
MEGFWLMHYEMGTGQGDGIAIFRAGEIAGGDFEHLWYGTYEQSGPRISARIRIVPSVSSADEEIMARDQPVIVSLSGYFTKDFARLEGRPEHSKNVRVEVTMRKCKGIGAQHQVAKANAA